MDRLHEKVQSDGIRLVFSRHFRGAFRLVTSQGVIAGRRELRLDELPRRRIVLNDKNPWGFAGSGCGYGRVRGFIRSDSSKGKRKIEAGTFAGLAFDP